MPETEAEQAQVLQSWTAWYGRLGSAVADPGNPLTPVVKSIASDGTKSDGPVGQTVSGYSIITADSLDADVSMAKSCPILEAGGQISVYETFPAM